MKCPSCGANVNTAFCEYCGAKMPLEQVEKQTIHADTVIVNNYYGEERNDGPYYQQPHQQQQYQQYQQYQQPSPPNPAYGNGTYIPAPQIQVSPKSRTVTLLLCIFFGIFGGHRFYLRRYLLGAIFLLTFGVFGIGWIVDLFLVVAGRMRDNYDLPVLRW